jgi:hypothetical protein
MERNPIPLTKAQAESLGRDEQVAVKMTDCTFYNSCLDAAVKGDWPNFGCNECLAYQAISIEQKAQDWLALVACAEAAENIENLGKANRRRGVKPGAEAKVSRRKLPVVPDQNEVESEEEMVEVPASSIVWG